MSLSKERIIYLLNAYSAQNVSEAEKQELFSWVNETGEHELLRHHIEKLTYQYNTKEPVPTVDWEQLYGRIINETAINKHNSKVRNISWLRWSAAAAIIILFSVGSYLSLNHSSKKILIAHTLQLPVNNDVTAPAANKAIITLSDGRKVQLDSIGNGTLARQGNVQVTKQPDGQIIYKGIAGESLYNTLTVPRGSKVVTIKLSDGTQVWLNSESSLRYPASFTGYERKVEITGEAYFEVAHNEAMPFIVEKDALQIKVLGTHFNINTYDDDGTSKVTLLEGSVKIIKDGKQNLLKPGQQAQISDNIQVINNINVDEVIAWKNGQFQFGDKADLHLIMKKIARWYDVDIAYEGGPVNQRFGGEMPMNSNLSQVLEILKTSGVKFKIDGKKVIVKP